MGLAPSATTNLAPNPQAVIAAGRVARDQDVLDRTGRRAQHGRGDGAQQRHVAVAHGQRQHGRDLQGGCRDVGRLEGIAVDDPPSHGVLGDARDDVDRGSCQSDPTARPAWPCPHEASSARRLAMPSAHRVSNTRAAPNMTAAQTTPSSAMVTESTEKTCQNSRLPGCAPPVAGIGLSPTLPCRICQESAAPTTRQTMPGTMKAARHEASVISTPGTMPCG